MNIFVMVGTHEQQFDRLIKYVDEKFQDQNVDMQIGFSAYVPKYSRYYRMLSEKQINDFIISSDIVITHGGPASILDVLRHKKVPIVVPRQKQFKEHINDHQVDFSLKMGQEKKAIVITDINDLYNVIQNYDSIVDEMNFSYVSNTDNFTSAFEAEITKLFERKNK